MSRFGVDEVRLAQVRDDCMISETRKVERLGTETGIRSKVQMHFILLYFSRLESQMVYQSSKFNALRHPHNPRPSTHPFNHRSSKRLKVATFAPHFEYFLQMLSLTPLFYHG